MQGIPRKLRMAMVGGGPGSFIGPVHRMAAELDAQIELVAGAFSSDARRSLEAAAGYGIDPSRAYPHYEALLAAERDREDAADFVAVVTPNHLHFPVAAAAIQSGYHVISDKPATTTLQEAQALAELVARHQQLYALTYTYTGYPMIRQARAMCMNGELGQIRKVVVEYVQGWLSKPLETSDQKQAKWRTDPAQAGAGGCIGDIGVHAFNLLEFVTGERVVKLCADLSSIVSGRQLDDDCNVLVRLRNGAPGVIQTTQIAAGERNGLTIRVFGERGSLRWEQERPNVLNVSWADHAAQMLHAGSSYLEPTACGSSRLPSGHPEGYIEAFANLYREFAACVRAKWSGETRTHDLINGIDKGVRSMRFVETAVTASREGRGWVHIA
ncbi:oxidoreductase domain-containing protein [Caballeronia hypogeia]|uniref:Oxidoreductase domain-containing protein n=1 Tax=Caballeronia hypogeia TaxID=1777140 RepID=A0A158CWR2_9BURK|nr:Gfo/Idh/MocA family oxidoreductase [Caballeronia hypogeia]SAK86366.1 oxidoreductase domain-containing protein [Caballeronia hypogeia]